MNKIKYVQVHGLHLHCLLNDGKIYDYDMSFILKEDGEMLIPLREPSFFQKVYIELGHLCWPNGYEIHANTVKREGVVIKNMA